MKNYHEVAQDVFRRRDAFEEKKWHKDVAFRCISSVMSAVAVVVMILCTAGTCYVLAASVGVIDDFLGIFQERNNNQLSAGQQSYIQTAVAEIGESVSCEGYTVTAQGAFTDGTVAYILLDIEAPEGVVIDGLGGIGFDTADREIVRGDNPEKRLNITGLSMTYVPVADHDGCDHTASVLLQISCIRLNGSTYSFADGYARYLELSEIHYYMDEYPYSCEVIAEGNWNFEIMFAQTQADDAEMLTAPIRMPMQRTMTADYVDTTISSIRIKGLGIDFYYTIDADDVQEPGDFGNVQVVMKDGSIVNAYPKSGSSVGNSEAGNRVFSCNYIAQAPIVIQDVDYVMIGDDTVIPVPETYCAE